MKQAKKKAPGRPVEFEEETARIVTRFTTAEHNALKARAKKNERNLSREVAAIVKATLQKEGLI